MCFSSYAQLVLCSLHSVFRSYPYIRGRQLPGHRLVDDHDALTTAFRFFFLIAPIAIYAPGIRGDSRASCTIFRMLLLRARSCSLNWPFHACILHSPSIAEGLEPLPGSLREYCTYALHVFPPYVTTPCGLLLDLSRWNILFNFTSMQRAAFMVFGYFFGGSWHVLVH